MLPGIFHAGEVMSNRVYFCCSDFTGLPDDEDFDAFSNASGIEYEASYTIPLFWLALFSAGDIALAKQNGLDDEDREYAYLFGDKAAGVERLRALSPAMRAALGARRFALYEEWIGRIAAEPFQHTLVRTVELDWMDDEGELERQLRAAFDDLEHARQTDDLRLGGAIRNLISVSSGESLEQIEGFRLAGAANASDEWPPRLTLPPPALAPSTKKSRWLFWLR
jgi:hypothetical protein